MWPVSGLIWQTECAGVKSSDARGSKSESSTRSMHMHGGGGDEDWVGSDVTSNISRLNCVQLVELVDPRQLISII